MGCLWAAFVRDLHLLRRDRGGLAILFIMPVALVLIVCLVQDNVLKSSGGGSVALVMLDEDGGLVSELLQTALKRSGAFRITRLEPGAGQNMEAIEGLVTAGRYQVGLYLPEQLSETLQRQALVQIRAVCSGLQPPAEHVLRLGYAFDPAVQGGLQAGFRGLLEQVSANASLRVQLEALHTVLPALLERHISQRLGDFYVRALADAPFDLPASDSLMPLLEAHPIRARKAFVMPSSVQHNVPAWSIFGIFFIVLPVSALLLQERSQGVSRRLVLAPASPLQLLLGRLLTFLLVALLQFVLMLGVGRFVLPRFGTDLFSAQGHLPAMFVIILCAALAACGFGLLLGAWSRTQQQATLTAAVTIVIAAALGGIMVPVYLMPAFMQPISLVSPLGWGLEAFQKLLLRGEPLAAAWPQLTALVSTGLICLLLAKKNLQRWSR
ncbi:MAG: ABC transporter permease [Desulfuromonadaceae bacterium]|nr:ABC transporter permease [Desulfuromonadaceae bacterium]